MITSKKINIDLVMLSNIQSVSKLLRLLQSVLDNSVCVCVYFSCLDFNQGSGPEFDSISLVSFHLEQSLCPGLIYNTLTFFLIARGLPSCTRAFSRLSEQGLLLVAVCGLLLCGAQVLGARASGGAAAGSVAAARGL